MNNKIRSEKEEEERVNNKRCQLDHVGDTSKWDLEECIEHVSNLQNGAYLNFSELARRYNIKHENVDYLKNGGQIIKKMLEDHNIDMTRFDYLGQNNNCRLRRKKIRLSDDISMPCEPTNSEVTEDLKLKIASGVYKMGEEIVPQNFKRVLILNGKPVISEIVVSGRKQPLRYT